MPQSGKLDVAVKLERWVNTMDHGFYSGDHHIHAAGCAHYTVPTEGVQAEDMFLHCKGEGLNVGCNLTWGPCYDYQRQFFEPTINKLSEPFCVLKYDIEVSGFGSQAMGHVCLLNLKDQTYPGSDGTKVRGWPKWTTPVMRWTKEQGGVTGYAHSASGLMFDPPANANMAAKGVITWLDKNKDGFIDQDEAAAGVLPEPVKTADTNSDGLVDANELLVSINRVKNKLPNLAIPPMNGIGAQEICVSTAMGVCDFISAMDTARVPEWNCWYHIMNCGFPLKASGETDFPCISGSRVGEGRVYVQLGKVDKVDFTKWCEGIAKGRSYVSDGYAHALDFRVGEQPSGGQLDLKQPGAVKVTAKVAFASETPLGTAKGGQVPPGNKRTVELVVNGKVADSVVVTADDKVHDPPPEAMGSVFRSPRQSVPYPEPWPHPGQVEPIASGRLVGAGRSGPRRRVGRVGDRQLGGDRGPDDGRHLGRAVVERARADGGGQLGVGRAPERGQPGGVGPGGAVARRQLALDLGEHPGGHPGVEAHPALGGRHHVALQELAHGLDQLGRRRRVVQRRDHRPALGNRGRGATGAAGGLVALGQQEQEVVLDLAHPAADGGQLDRADHPGQVGRGLDHADDPPLERAQHLPPVQRVAVDDLARGGLVRPDQLVDRPEPADPRLGPEPPGPHAQPAQVLERVAAVGQLPVEHRPQPVGSDDEVPVAEVAVDDRVPRADGRGPVARQPAEAQLEGRVRLADRVERGPELGDLVAAGPARAPRRARCGGCGPAPRRTGRRAGGGRPRTRRRAGSCGRSSRRRRGRPPSTPRRAAVLGARVRGRRRRSPPPRGPGRPRPPRPAAGRPRSPCRRCACRPGARAAGSAAGRRRRTTTSRATRRPTAAAGR